MLPAISNELKMMLKTVVVLGVVASLAVSFTTAQRGEVAEGDNTQVVVVQGDEAPVVRQKRGLIGLGLLGAGAVGAGVLGAGALAAGGLLAKGALLG